MFTPLDGKAVRVHITRNDRSRADDGAVAYPHWGAERTVGTNESAFANLGPVLAEAAEIAGDGTGANVGTCTDRRVADIGQVVDLGAVPDIGVLQFNEVADLGAVRKPRARAYPRERTDFGSGADVC